MNNVYVWWEQGGVCKMTQTYENMKYSFQHNDASVRTNNTNRANAVQKLTCMEVVIHMWDLVYNKERSFSQESINSLNTNYELSGD